MPCLSGAKRTNSSIQNHHLLHFALDEHIQKRNIPTVGRLQNQAGILRAAGDVHQLVADLFGEARGLEEVVGAFFFLEF